jgi:hypothetical protein
MANKDLGDGGWEPAAWYALETVISWRRSYKEIRCARYRTDTDGWIELHKLERETPGVQV